MATNSPEQKNTRMARLHANDGTKKARPVLRVIKWLFLLFFLLIISGVGVFAYYAKDAPSISTAKLQSGGTSSFYTTDGKFLMSLGSQTRVYAKDSAIPQTLKDAVVSIEDKRFYSESLGIDPLRIVSSFLTNVKSSSTVAGGSTITQQLVKLTCFSTASSQRTLSRKAQEAWLAMKVEREYSKDQILEFYINKVYMNYGTYGMGTAANYYYGKSLKQLDLAQLALLAGMPNAPVAYNPYLYPKKAKYRRDLVLKAMYDNKKITKKQYLVAKAEDVQKGLKK
ncbi:transglycosylase domain-containing protein, partial [Lactobacillus delbrueckii]